MGKKIKTQTQVIWGAALTLVGVSLFLRIPHIIDGIEQIDQFSNSVKCVKFCLYFMGTSLVIGGVKKLFKHTRR